MVAGRLPMIEVHQASSSKHSTGVPDCRICAALVGIDDPLLRVFSGLQNPSVSDDRTRLRLPRICSVHGAQLISEGRSFSFLA